MNKLIIFILIIVAVLFGGKLGLEYYYGKKLDELISHASFVADIDYQNVKIGIDSSISINNLSIQPHAADTSVRMGSITLFSSDRLLPLNLASFIKRTEFPDELGIRIVNMEYYPGAFETAIRQDDECRHIETTMRTKLTGINRLNANIETSINVNSNNGVISISSTDQMAEMELRAAFDAGMLNTASSGQTTQPFDEINVKYKLNEQVATQLIQTCAKQLAISTDEYLNNVVGSPNYLRFTGVDFGVDAKQAMVDLIQGGKWLSISSKPSPQLNSLNSLNFYQAKDIVRLLGLKVSVDSQEVALNISELQLIDASDDVGTSEPELISAEQIERLSELSPEEQQRIKLKLQEEAKTNTAQYSYQSTPISNLNRYINYSVIFKRSGDMKQMSGELVAIDDNVFIIETNQYGGKAQFNIPLTDVIDVQVYR